MSARSVRQDYPTLARIEAREAFRDQWLGTSPDQRPTTINELTALMDECEQLRMEAGRG